MRCAYVKQGDLMGRNIKIIEEKDGTRVVHIDELKFRGKRNINWNDVEGYLKKFVGNNYMIESTGDVIYIKSDFPDEYAHSNYTRILKGANAKAKANAAMGIPEIIKTATGKRFEKNRKDKHNCNAKYGWYRYESKFEIPVYENYNQIVGFNVFNVAMLVRHDKDGKMYLYDIMNIKKETSKPFQSNDLTK